MEVLRSKDGELYTTCAYQHNVTIDCNDCCNGKLEQAVRDFLTAELTMGERYHEQEIVMWARAAAKAGMTIPAPAFIGSEERERQFASFQAFLEQKSTERQN